MYVTVLGYQRKTGVFEGKPFDNFYLHCVGKNAKVNGDAVSQIKISPEVLSPVIMQVGGTPDGLIRKTLFLDKDMSDNFDTAELAAPDDVK